MINHGRMENIDERRSQLAQLLVAAGRGSEQAFTALHSATRSYLYHVALRVLGRPARAEEVLQDAYLSIWLQAGRFQPEIGSAMTWLITVVRNQAISALRAQRADQNTLSLSDETKKFDEALIGDEDGADPIHHAFYASAKCRLPRALQSLEPGPRQAIALTFHHGLGHAEISAHMNVPLGTVKSWLRRGITRLGHQIVHDPAFPAPPPPKACATPHRRATISD